jgi:plastocyanin
MKKYSALFLTFFFLSTPAYAGTLSGKVVFNGTAPAAQTLDMNADPTCAGAHSGPVTSEEVLVNANGTLKNVFVYVKEGLEGKTFPAAATAVNLDQKGCRYTPHVFGVQVGQPINIINSDPTLHNVHGMPANSKEFNIGMPIQNMKLTRKFDAPEVMVKFKCDVHPWMSAYAGVLAHPFFAVTGDEGTFEIKDLPAGTYVVEAWHEKYGVQTQSLTVTDAAQTADFTFAG